MTKKIIARGAEAVLVVDEKKQRLIKYRIKKSYRHEQLDKKLRRQRTKREGKIIEKLSNIISVPLIYNIDEKRFLIEMEFIEGKRLSDELEAMKEERKHIAEEIGKNIALMHNVNIIHGDLTTSNMIYRDGNVYFIDFGLAFHSNRIEDKAVDVYLFIQALKSKHYEIFKEFSQDVLNSYFKHVNDANKIKTQLKKVEERGRYKKQREEEMMIV